jgi:hypothetical protein
MPQQSLKAVYNSTTCLTAQSLLLYDTGSVSSAVTLVLLGGGVGSLAVTPLPLPDAAVAVVPLVPV